MSKSSGVEQGDAIKQVQDAILLITTQRNINIFSDELFNKAFALYVRIIVSVWKIEIT